MQQKVRHIAANNSVIIILIFSFIIIHIFMYSFSFSKHWNSKYKSFCGSHFHYLCLECHSQLLRKNQSEITRNFIGRFYQLCSLKYQNIQDDILMEIKCLRRCLSRAKRLSQGVLSWGRDIMIRVHGLHVSIKHIKGCLREFACLSVTSYLVQKVKKGLVNLDG